MRNKKDEKLISDPREISEAYLSINTHTHPINEDCDILYANQYVQQEPKPMSEDLAKLFNSDAIRLNNPNLWEQISRIMNQYDAEFGPWYVTGDDNTLIIQNSTPGPDSGFVFKYQEEYGEVLKVRIAKKEVYGARAMKAMSLPDHNREQTQVVIEPVNNDSLMGMFKAMDRNHSRLDTLNITTRGEEVYNRGRVSYYDSVLRSQEEARQWREEQETKYNWNEAFAQNPTLTQNQVMSNRQKFLDEMDPLKLKQMRDILEDTGKSLPGEESLGMRLSFLNILNNIDHVEYEPGEREKLDGGDPRHRHLIDTPGVANILYFKPATIQIARNMQRSFALAYGSRKTGEVDLGATIQVQLSGKEAVTATQVAQAYSKATGKTFDEYDAKVIYLTQDFREQQEKWSKMGYNVKNLTYKVDVETGQPIIIPDLRRISEQTYVTSLDCMKAIAESEKNLNLHSAFSAAMAAANNMRNNLKRAKHQELEVELRVVGRPQLKAGIVITLLGIGKRYSGKWFVKTCIHQMDNTGYTCSLTLQKNEMTAPKGQSSSYSTAKDSTGRVKTTSTSPSDITGVGMSRADTVLMYRDLNRAAREGNYFRKGEHITAAQGIFENAKAGKPSLSTWTNRGIETDFNRYNKAKEKAEEIRKQKLATEKEVADAASKAKRIKTNFK